MSTYALIMGRAGSVSVAKKNVRHVAGHPLVTYPIRAASGAKSVDRVYVTTDCPEIKRIAKSWRVSIIDRPSHLSEADSEMSDAIVHALGEMSPAPDILVTMHANCGIHRDGLIDECVARLLGDSSLDSCVSAVDVGGMHPYRLKRVREDGTLTTWVDIPDAVQNNRQAIRDKAVVLDGAARAFRVARCLPPRGQPPFRYLGQRIGFVENPGGLDVHTEADLFATERWLLSQLPAWYSVG